MPAYIDSILGEFQLFLDPISLGNEVRKRRGVGKYRDLEKQGLFA